MLAKVLDLATNFMNMVIRKILSSPVLLIISFLGIIISGESFGGFYVWYLINALKEGILYSILGLSGISLILIVSAFADRQYLKTLASLLNLVAGLLLISSLIVFFMNKGGAYNWSTFQQIIPLTSLIIFSSLLFVFFYKNLTRVR